MFYCNEHPLFMVKSQQLLSSIAQWSLIASLALVPLFFLPFTQDFYDTNKWLLLVAAAVVLLVVTGLGAALTGNLTVTLSPLVIGLASLTAASLVSLFTASTNRWEALLAPMGAGTFAALTLITLLGSHTLSGSGKRLLLFIIEAVAALAAGIAILQFFGIGKSISPNVPFLADPLWTPIGSSVALVVLLVMVLPFVVEQILIEAKKKTPLTITLGLVAVFIATGLGVTLWKIIPLVPTTFLPLSDAWAMTLEVLKSPRQAITGVGAENFIAAFTTGRTATLNTNAFLGLRFNLNATFLFHMITTFGFIGLGAAMLFLKSLLPRLQPLTASSISLTVAVAALLLLPPNLTLLAAIVAIWLITHPTQDDQKTFRLPAHVKTVQYGVLAVFVIAAAVTLYGVGRAYAAELTFFRSLAAASQNKGTDTYNLQIQTIGYNPFIARYHLTYSQTNLAIASAITSGGTPNQPKTLTDQDRQTVTTLIQQSIREAKIATQLAPANVFMWENLARIYQSLIGVAQGSDTWTVAALQQAIALDPTNPILRLDLGGIYVAGQNYDTALQQFLVAANLKQDYANAYYNIANVSRLMGNTDRAIAALQTTLTLVKPDTSDYAKAQNELNDLQKQKAPLPAAGKAKGEETLTKPPTSTAPIVVPPLTISP